MNNLLKSRFRFLPVIFLCGFLFSGCDQVSPVKPEDPSEEPFPSDTYNPVDLSMLLDEMIDRDALTRFPDPAYICYQASSYDRRSKSPSENWFANGDSNNFIRTEYNYGREERVLMDAEGPGAIVRWWITASQYDSIVRVYLNGSDEPVIQANINSLVGGDYLTGAPLSAETSYGLNLYLPITYNRRCKVTVEYNPRGVQSGLYYQINYRTYTYGTPVRTFTMNNFNSLSEKIDAVQEILRTGGFAPGGVVSGSALNTSGIVIPKNGSYTFDTINGPNTALKKIVFKVDTGSDNLAQSLRSTVISIKFDGKETVWCPLGDFFGSGVGINPYKSWFTVVQNDGTLTSQWSMPFINTAEITLINYSENDFEIEAYAFTTGPYQWDKRSMYFHANWRQQRNIKTIAWGGTMDWNYIKINGRGIFVGDVLSVLNRHVMWWGEGDEKIYVDGETFPSHFGTGTEDYYGYAWCSPKLFESPFHFQPRAEGPGNYGNTTNARVRLLDGIPFRRDFRFDMEILHQAATEIDYAAATFWYAFDGASTADFQTRTEQIAEARSAVLYKMPVDYNIPGFRVEKDPTRGTIQLQGMGGFGSGWDNNDQLWWTGGRPGDKLELVCDTIPQGTYKLSARLTKAKDYGIVQFWVDGVEIGGHIDLYNPDVIPFAIDIGIVVFSAGGEHGVEIEIIGANASAVASYMVGVDILRFDPVP